jgi:hypothetical protein
VPTLACATAAAIALLVLARHGQGLEGQGGSDITPPVATAPTPGTHVPAPSMASASAKDPHAGHAFVFLDGEAIDVDDVPEAQMLDSLKPSPDIAAREAKENDDDSNDGLLGSPAGLAWVDDLDNAKLDRLENVLTSAPTKKGT